MGIAGLYGKPDDEEIEVKEKISKVEEVKGDKITDEEQSTPAIAQEAEEARKKTNALPLRPEKSVKRQNVKAAKKEYVMTYFSEENYNCFEEMFDFIKKQIRQKTGTKLKATNMAEISIMIAYDLFKEEKSNFVE